MLIAALLTLAIPLLESQVLIEAGTRRAQFASDKAHFEAHFAQVLNGPTAEEIATAVGDVGPWLLLSGSAYPMNRADPFFDRSERVADLAGRTVRFAFVGQCTADTEGAELLGYGQIWGTRTTDGNPLDSSNIDFATIPCDGELHVVTADAVDLPAWDGRTLEGAKRRDWMLVGAGAVLTPRVETGSNFATYGNRWLVFVAPDPAPSTEPLLQAVAAHLDPLRHP
jgi:hypothetical protein